MIVSSYTLTSVLQSKYKVYRVFCQPGCQIRYIIEEKTSQLHKRILFSKFSMNDREKGLLKTVTLIMLSYCALVFDIKYSVQCTMCFDYLLLLEIFFEQYNKCQKISGIFELFFCSQYVDALTKSVLKSHDTLYSCPLCNVNVC